MSEYRDQLPQGYSQPLQYYDQRTPAQEPQPDLASKTSIQLRPIKSPGGNAYAFGNLYGSFALYIDDFLLILLQSCRISTRFSAPAGRVRHLHTRKPQLRP